MGVQVSSLAPPVKSEGYPDSGNPVLLSKKSVQPLVQPLAIAPTLNSTIWVKPSAPCAYLPPRMCQLKLKVAGPNPVSRSNKHPGILRDSFLFARLSQERLHLAGVPPLFPPLEVKPKIGKNLQAVPFQPLDIAAVDLIHICLLP